MKTKIGKRSVATVMALVLCFSVAVVSFAVPAVGASQRTVTVDFGTVVNEDYAGLGNNLWLGKYYTEDTGMNDAYQTVNDMRSNVVKPAYMRMLMYPSHIMDFSLDAATQEENWKNGIYNFENEEFLGYAQAAKALSDLGTDILLNFGGMVTDEVAEWFAIKGADRTANGTKTGPRDIESFAKACAATAKKLMDMGVNVKYISFYNETNYQNFEAFFDKRIYLTETIIAVHKAFVDLGIRDKVEIFACDLVGQYDGDMATTKEMMDFFYKELVVPGYADILNTHVYHHGNTREYVMGQYDNAMEQIKANFGDTKFYINEVDGRNVDDTSGSAEKDLSFGVNIVSHIIKHSNIGVNGSAGWFYHSARLPLPHLQSMDGINHGLWNFPSRGLAEVSTKYQDQGLMMRYIPKHSKVVKSTPDSDDILSAVYVKGDDTTILLEVDKADTERNLKINLGKAYAGKKFGLHENHFADDNNGDGLKDNRLPSEYGEILVPRTQVIEVDDEGFLNWTIPCNEEKDLSMSLIFTTLDEQIQVELKETELSVDVNGSVEIEVADVHGIDCNDFNFEIYDFSPLGEADDYARASVDVCNSVGSIAVNGKKAVFTANGNVVKKGDTIAVKITPKVPMPDETAGYAIAIIHVGQYRLYTAHKLNTGGASNYKEKNHLIDFGAVEDLIKDPEVPKGYTFKGWYDNPEFTGEALTKTDASWNSTTRLYGKVVKEEE